MMERIETVNRWTKVSLDLFAVTSPDGRTLMVGWRRPDDAQPVTCALAQLVKPVQPREWAEILRTGLRLSTIGRDKASRAAAIVAVEKFGGVVLRHEDREPHLKVC